MCGQRGGRDPAGNAKETSTTLPRLLQAFCAPRILCAYNADPAGEHAGDALRRNAPNRSRLRPIGAKDWNDLLRSSLPR